MEEFEELDPLVPEVVPELEPLVPEVVPEFWLFWLTYEVVTLATFQPIPSRTSSMV